MNPNIIISGNLIASLISEAYNIENNDQRYFGLLFGSRSLNTSVIIHDSQPDQEVIEMNINILEYINLHQDILTYVHSTDSFVDTLQTPRQDIIGVVVLKRDGVMFPSFQELKLLSTLDTDNNKYLNVLLIINIPRSDHIEWIHGFNYAAYSLESIKNNVIPIPVSIPSLSVDSKQEYLNSRCLHLENNLSQQLVSLVNR